MRKVWGHRTRWYGLSFHGTFREGTVFFGGGGCQLLAQAFLVYLPYLAKLIKNNKHCSAGKGFICLAEGCEFVMGHSVVVI